MSTNEPMTQERLDAIQGRLNGIEFHDLEVWEESWPAGKREALIVNLGFAITDAHPDSDNAIFPVGVAQLFAHAPQDLADLLAEVERLRARLTVDEDMVERGVRAHRETVNAWPVKRSLEDSDNRRAAAMRAALDAALGTGEES